MLDSVSLDQLRVLIAVSARYLNDAVLMRRLPSMVFHISG
jgi:hypothetical protein